jgi:hypothetical protein
VAEQFVVNPNVKPDIAAATAYQKFAAARQADGLVNPAEMDTYRARFFDAAKKQSDARAAVLMDERRTQAYIKNLAENPADAQSLIGLMNSLNNQINGLRQQIPPTIAMLPPDNPIRARFAPQMTRMTQLQSALDKMLPDAARRLNMSPDAVLELVKAMSDDVSSSGAAGARDLPPQELESLNRKFDGFSKDDLITYLQDALKMGVISQATYDWISRKRGIKTPLMTTGSGGRQNYE